MDLTERLTDFDYLTTRQILEAARSLPDDKLDAPLAGFDNPLLYTEEKKTLREMLHRLVLTKEVWLAAVHGQPAPESYDLSVSGMLGRMETAFAEYKKLVKRVKDENLWETSFMDILCDPPEAFTYGGMISHITTFTEYRRTVALEALEKAGVHGLGYGEPLLWKR